MIPSFENFYNKKENITKPTKTSRKHTQSANRGMLDRKNLYFVPHSDNKKRAHSFIKRFEKNQNLNFIPLATREIALELASLYGLNIEKEQNNFSKPLKRTGLNLIKYNNKYGIIRK
jgi:hypothetical protein